MIELIIAKATLDVLVWRLQRAVDEMEVYG